MMSQVCLWVERRFGVRRNLKKVRNAARPIRGYILDVKRRHFYNLHSIEERQHDGKGYGMRLRDSSLLIKMQLY